MKKRKKVKKNTKFIKKVGKFLNDNKLISVMIAFTCLIVVFLGTKATYSALTTNDDEQNNMQISDLRITVEENFTPYQGFKAKEPSKKEAWAINQSNMPVFIDAEIRPFIEIYLEDPTYNPPTYYAHKVDPEEFLELEINTTDWLISEVINETTNKPRTPRQIRYYHKNKVMPGEKTNPVMYSVTMKMDPDEILDYIRKSTHRNNLRYRPGTDPEDEIHLQVMIEFYSVIATKDAYKYWGGVGEDVTTIWEPQAIKSN